MFPFQGNYGPWTLVRSSQSLEPQMVALPVRRPEELVNLFEILISVLAWPTRRQHGLFVDVVIIFAIVPAAASESAFAWPMGETPVPSLMALGFGT